MVRGGPRGDDALSTFLAWIVLARTPAFVPGLTIFVVVAGVVLAVIVALPAGRVPRPTAIAAMCLAVAALSLGPAAYALDTVGTAYTGGTVSAGPASDSDGSVAVNGVGQPDRRLAPATLDYLVANRGVARWVVAVATADIAGPIELTTGLPVMAMGGFAGDDEALTLVELQGFLKRGELRYVLPGVAVDPDDATIAGWVTTACAPVTGTATTGLYDCASRPGLTRRCGDRRRAATTSSAGRWTTHTPQEY